MFGNIDGDNNMALGQGPSATNVSGIATLPWYPGARWHQPL